MLVYSRESPKGIVKAFERSENVLPTNFVRYSNGRGYLTNHTKYLGPPWNNRPTDKWWLMAPINLVEWNEE